MTKEGSLLAQVSRRQILAIGIGLGAWQGLVLMISYYLTSFFIDHHAPIIYRLTNEPYLIVMLLLFGLALYLIYKGQKEKGVQIERSRPITGSQIIKYGMETNIDSIVVGVCLAILNLSVRPFVLLIIIINVIAVAIGVYVGRHFGYEHADKFYTVAGVSFILIAIF
ncbi:manganese efflux pump [Fundicoccus culcitae]|uniref:Manganese efflux pump n=1 Tax=Fundicoccus culcitae TaxID=2969821 RepID=A0ABY5P4R4_9LACT|nr:manganese efflux pump [Fundicoccus culcitae]UUX33696.1 manganese efflux pump [Fundicoccus culcitae]